MQNLRGFKVTAIKATDTKPERVQIEDLRHNKKVVLSYSCHSPNTKDDLAVWFLASKGIEIETQTWCEKNSISIYTILLSTNFKNQIK